MVRRQGGERGDQACPRFKSNATADCSCPPFMASVTGCYIGRVIEPTYDNHVMRPTLYPDAQIGDRVTLTLCGGNILGKQAHDGLDCDGFDPTTYDLPDQVGYARTGVTF